jgi:hypothetical protein
MLPMMISDSDDPPIDPLDWLLALALVTRRLRQLDASVGAIVDDAIPRAADGSIGDDTS